MQELPYRHKRLGDISEDERTYMKKTTVDERRTGDHTSR